MACGAKANEPARVSTQAAEKEAGVIVIDVPGRNSPQRCHGAGRGILHYHTRVVKKCLRDLHWPLLDAYADADVACVRRCQIPMLWKDGMFDHLIVKRVPLQDDPFHMRIRYLTRVRAKRFLRDVLRGLSSPAEIYRPRGYRPSPTSPAAALHGSGLEPYAERGSAAGRLGDIDPGAVGGGNLADEGEADAAALALGGEEGDEDLLALVVRNT